MESNTNIYSDIVSITKTPDDVALALDELSLLSQALFETKTPVTQVIHDRVRVVMARALTHALTKQGISWNNIEQVEAFLRGAEDLLKQLERIEITIAVEPTAAMEDRITTAARQSFGQNTIVEFRVERTIIGGALIVHKGIYKDYSLKKQLPELLNTPTHS